MKILFVCLGNICRSPTAEGVFRSFAPEVDVDSAGTGGWHVGEPPYGPMQAAAKARGWKAHLFEHPEGWAERLVAEGLLTEAETRP